MVVDIAITESRSKDDFLRFSSKIKALTDLKKYSEILRGNGSEKDLQALTT